MERMNGTYFEVARDDLAEKASSIYRRLTQGEIIVVRNAQEVHKLIELIVSAVTEAGGPHCGNEIAAWLAASKTPDAEACVHLANVLLEMKDAGVFPTLMTDFVRSLNFPGPVCVEGGAPRFNLPLSLEEAFIAQKNDLKPGVLEDLGKDPARHVMLMPTNSQRPHRDIGRPHTAFMTNVWCALQDLDESQTLILFPEAYRDTSHDSDEYAWKGSGEPSSWGFGTALQIPLNAGDMILFHGDHLHSSPVAPGDLLRLSWENRVVSKCYDDMGWYRLGFKNQNNFISGSREESQSDSLERGQHIWSQRLAPPNHPCDHLKNAPKMTTGRQILGWLINQPELSEEFFIEAVEALYKLPFAEDRFVWPLFTAQKSFAEKKIDKDILRFVIDRTKNYYWACIFGGLAIGADEIDLAKSAFAKAKKLAKLTEVSCETNPVNYFEALAVGNSTLIPMIYHITPQDVDEVIRLYEEGHVMKGIHGSTVELVLGTPHPKGMFRPCYPFIEPVPGVFLPESEVTLLKRLINRLRRLFRMANEKTAPSSRRKLQVGNNWLAY